MACKTMLILALFATMASLILSSPQQVEIQPLPAEAKEVVAEYLAEKLQEGIPAMQQEIQSRTFGSLFNLSAYINNANRPVNQSALTVVPLITILSSLVGTG